MSSHPMRAIAILTAAIVMASAAVGCGGRPSQFAPLERPSDVTPPRASGRAVEVRSPLRVGRAHVFVRAPIPLGWRPSSASAPIIVLFRDVPHPCRSLVSVWVVPAGTGTGFEPLLRGPSRAASVRVVAGERSMRARATIRYSGPGSQRGNEGQPIGEAAAVSIAELDAPGLVPLRIVASGLGGDERCGASRQRTATEMDGALRTINAGLVLRVARRGPRYAIVISRDR